MDRIEGELWRETEGELFRLLAENVTDYAIFVVDSMGRICTWNGGAERLLGYRDNEIIGHSADVLFTPEDVQAGVPQREMEEALVVGRGNDDRWHVRKDGSRFWSGGTMTPLRDESGAVRGFAKIMRDRTDWKLRHDAALEQARLAAFSRDIGLALIQADTLPEMLRHCADAMVAHLTGAFARIWTLDETQDVLELRASAGIYTHLDGPHSRVPVGKYKIGLIAAERQPHLTNSVVGDPRVSDQEWAERERMVSFAGYPLIVDEKVVGVMAMFAKHPLSDATLEAMASVANGIAIGIERKTADEQRRQQQEWLSVTLSSIGDAVIATDAKGIVTFLNGVAQQLTGWDQDAAQGQPLVNVFNILHEETREPVDSPVLKVLETGRIVGLGNHTILVARDGRIHPIDDSAAPIQDSTGNTIGVVLIFRDVTAQRRSANELRQSEGRKAAILETALDCIITIDHHGSVVDFNPAAERTFGYRREQIIGQPLAEFIIPPALREQHWRGLARYLATGEGPILGKRLELSAVRADGVEIPVELAIARIGTEGPPLFTAYLRDLSERKRLEQNRNVRISVTQALGEADDVQDGAARMLRAVCENLGWEVGFFWSVDGGETALHYVQGWHEPHVGIAKFEEESCRRTFARGEGLPGTVWSTGQPRWLLDVVAEPAFPRAAAAAQHNLHSAFACPVIVGDRTLGVIEFFTQRIHEPDDDLLEMMGTIAGSFGQFLRRTKAEAAIRQSERELADFFDSATVGLHWVGADGAILRANRAELELLGYSHDEYIGRHIAEFHADEEVICDILSRLQAGEQLREYPARLRCKDGSIKDVLIDSSVMFGNSGFLHTRCFTRDVTQRKRMDQELQQTQRRLQAVFNQQFQFMAILSPDGRVLEANDTSFRATGVSRDQVLGQPLWDTPWWNRLPVMQERWRQYVAEVARGGGPVLGDTDYSLADGTIRHATAVVTGIKNDEGEVTSIVVEGHDDTERRQHEFALRESEERLRLALDAGRMGVWDWNILTGELSWSDSLEPLHGLAPGTFDGTFEHFQRLIHPDDRELVNAAIQHAIEARSTFDVEFRNVWQNGGVHWIAGSGRVFVDDRGAPHRMIGIGLDVTERKRTAETAKFLADASAALALLVDSDSTLQKVATLAVPHFADWASVDILEADGTLRRVAVAHVDPRKIELARDLHQRFPPDPNAPNGVWNILRTGEAELVSHITDDLLSESTQDEALLAILRELGLTSYIGVPLRVRGKVMGVLTFIVAESGHSYDSTDLAVANDLASRAAIAVENSQLYRELRNADRQKDEFLATLAHELRNPLAPIRNGLQVLRLAGAGGEIFDEARAMMERQLSQMVRLVDDLLDISRITRNKLELRKERVSFAEVVHSAVETSRPLIEENGHTFSLTLPPEPIYVNADQTRLAQVLSNLLNNAAKYTEPGGQIALTAEVIKGEVVLRVSDNGLGIPAEAMPTLFQMFSQVEHNMDRAQGGLGIGLTLVRRLVEMHGGTVAAHSEGAGRGSEFTVRLPVHHASRSHRPVSVKEDVAATARRRILVVDDNRDSATSLAMMLKLLGSEIHAAHDGWEAVEAAEQFRPDIILLDIGLPKLNGYEVCRRIREQPWSGDVVIVAITGWGQEEDRRRSAEAGFNHHLVKPVELDALARLLNRR